jgi:AraC family transcriptional regulator, exoenzyme S synthesis regulatory protein ExsA
LELREIAFLANMSLSTFKSHFEREYHTKPGKWLRERRLNYAKLLIDQEKKSSKQIFAQLGYSSLSNFNLAFKKCFGYTPRNV